LVRAGAAGKATWSAAFVLKTREELRAGCNVLEGRHTVAAARQTASRQVVAKRSPGACRSSPMRSAPSMEKEQRDSASSAPSATTPGAGSAAAVKARRDAGREPSGRGLVVSTAATCVLVSARGREGEAAGIHIAAHARRHGAAADTVTAPARVKDAKRRRLSKADAAAPAWLAAFNNWGLKYEPDVARDLVVIFSPCDALLPFSSRTTPLLSPSGALLQTVTPSSRGLWTCSRRDLGAGGRVTRERELVVVSLV